MAKTRDTKDLRWALRVAPSDDALVRAASDLTDIGLASFVRRAAVREARRVLADRTTFELDEARWKQLTELLDRPARVPAGLRKLYAKPSVFE